MEETVKKREWVKNAAIIFLSVMLVLTFFSNTFMNRTLPEVSTQQVSSGTINTKIRGSGTVTANTTYEVMLEQTRTVDSVLVKNGQEVATGELLFTLKASDSEELENAKESLYNAEIEYRKALINASNDDKYSSEREAVDSAEKALAAAKKKIGEKPSIGDIKTNINNANAAVESAQSIYDTAEEKYNEIYNIQNNKLEGLTGSVLGDDPYKPSEAIKYVKLFSEAEKNERYYDSIGDASSKEIWTNAKDEYEGHLILLLAGGGTDINPFIECYNAITAEEKSKDDAASALSAAQAQLSAYEKDYADYSEKLDEYQNAVDSLSTYQDAVHAAYNALESAVSADKISDQLQEIDFEVMKRNIAKIEKEISELSSKDEGNEITAKVAGVIGDLNITSGSVIQPATAVATIQQNDRGYSVKISVTTEQSKKVSIGDTAEVGNYYWWGDAITAVLSNIAPDPSSAGKNKFLIFDISGEVDVGTNLEISIGQKSANYDAIIPNSALRNDTNGDFVLAITQKSSPLGNRYVATRVDVKILAKDDTSAAITGIASGEYVITTSSKPIEAGQLVRMAEG